VNFRLSKEIQRAFCLAYYIGPSRSDITDWPKDFADQQITTEQKVNSLVFPDDEKVAAKRKEWTLKWQEVMA
jgi:ABC-type thiamine transport system substrate-binding protein